MRRHLGLALLLGLAGCTSSHGRSVPDDAGMRADGGGIDRDGDGFEEDVDCNDANPAVNPGADEVCSAVSCDVSGPMIDEDCDGAVDEGCPITNCFPEDWDADGWPAWDDCDDTDPTVYPGADEQCNLSCDDPGDGKDNDCDGTVDEDCFVTNCAIDADGDGWVGSGWSPEGTYDCDDSNPAVNPGADEVCGDGIDNDCDGAADDLDPEGCFFINGMADAPPDDTSLA